MIASADEPSVTRELQNHNVQTLTYGIHKNADVTAQIFDQTDGVSTLLLTHQDSTTVMETYLCGHAMASNHAAAAIVGLLLAEPLERIAESLSQLRTVPGRGQRLAEYGKSTVVIDAGGTPARAVEAMRPCRDMKAGGKLWCVLVLDAKADADTLCTIRALSWKTFFRSSNHHCNGPIAVWFFWQRPTMCSMASKNVRASAWFANRHRAIEWAVTEAAPQDTILIITGERGLTAHEQRTNLSNIEQCVEQSRGHAGKIEMDSKPKLSVFGI